MLDFPAAPYNGQQFAAPNGVVYQWAAPPNIWTTAFVGSTKPPTIVAYPEEFGAVGNGTTDDSTAIGAWLNYCTANNLKAVATPGKKYNVAEGFNGVIRTDFDGSGAEFLTGINGYGAQMFTIESLDEDIDDWTNDEALAEVNTWTGLYKGSGRIPELAGQKGWSYYFYCSKTVAGPPPVTTNDEVFIERATYAFGTAGQAKGEAFSVVDHEGRLNKTLVTDYPQGVFKNMTGGRRRIRHRMVVKNLTIRVVRAASTVERNRMVYIFRPNTTLLGCSIVNETATTIQQGWIHINTTNILYENCTVRGLTPDNYLTSTNYGFAGSYTDDVTFRNCHASECRRNVDAGACSNYVIDGGVFNDGVGGHWLDGLYIHGNPYISNQHPDNPTPIHISGSNLNCESARVYVKATGYTSAAFDVRADLPECWGIYRIGPGVTITFDDDHYIPWANNFAYRIGRLVKDATTGLPWRCEVAHTSAASGTFAEDRIARPTYWAAYAQATKAVLNFPAIPPYNAGRPVLMPTTIDVRPGLIRQLGQASENYLGMVNFYDHTSTEFTQNYVMPKQIIIEPGAIELEGGWMLPVANSERLFVGLRKADKSVSADYPRWRNLKLYRVGDVAYDIPGKTQWRCLVLHTSAGWVGGVAGSTLTTFAQDRVARPTLWTAHTMSTDTCDVRIRGIRRFNLLNNMASAAAGTATGRYDIEVDGLTDNGAQIGAPYGVTRKVTVRNCHPGTLVLTGSFVTALGDEDVRWEPEERGFYNPVLVAVTNIASGPTTSSCAYTYLRHQEGVSGTVHGNLSLTPTAGATLTSLQITLPAIPNITADITSVSQVVGFGSLSSGGAMGSITGDPATNRATFSFTSVNASPHTMYYQLRFWYGI